MFRGPGQDGIRFCSADIRTNHSTGQPNNQSKLKDNMSIIWSHCRSEKGRKKNLSWCRQQRKSSKQAESFELLATFFNSTCEHANISTILLSLDQLLGLIFLLWGMRPRDSFLFGLFKVDLLERRRKKRIKRRGGEGRKEKEEGSS